MFMPSREPAFVTVPGNSFSEPFSLAPGIWIFNIMAGEGVLLVRSISVFTVFVLLRTESVQAHSIRKYKRNVRS